jgi:hypothetical protein
MTHSVDRTEARKPDTCDVESVFIIPGINAIRGKEVSGLASRRGAILSGPDGAPPWRGAKLGLRTRAFRPNSLRKIRERALFFPPL